MATDEAVLAGARALLAQKQYAPLVELLSPLVHETPDNPEAWEFLAAAHFELKHWPEAETAAAQVVRLKPNSARALCNWGTVLRKAGRPEEAREAQTRALRIAPAYEPAQAELRKIERDERPATPGRASDTPVLTRAADHPVCPSCDARVYPTDRVCVACGAELPPQPAGAPGPRERRRDPIVELVASPVPNGAEGGASEVGRALLHRQARFLGLAGAVVLVMVAVAFVGARARDSGRRGGPSRPRPVAHRQATAQHVSMPRNATFADVTDAIMASTVLVATDRAEGTGVVVGDGRWVVTNAHVLRGGSRVLVHRPNQPPWEATLAAWDEMADVAVIRVQDPSFSAPSARLADPAIVRQGEEIGVAGYPLGTDLADDRGIRGASPSVVRGVVSAVRQYRGHHVVQFDAAMAPGYSGGPVFLARTGEVIALATSGIIDSEIGSTGVQLGIGADSVTALVEQATSHDHPPRS